MAKAGDKRRLEENAAHLKKLKIILVVANAVFVVGRLLLQRQSLSTWHYLVFALTSGLYALCFSTISTALAPHYSPAGELIYSGADLKTGGAISYYHDVLYVSAFCQVLGAYTNYAWLVLLSVPGYALYMLFSKVLLPSWTSTNEEAPESEADRRRREKKERQAARAQKFAATRK